MIKALRERIWFIKGFVQKYSKQIISSLTLTIILALLLNIVSSRVPHSKKEIKVGIVGQYSSGQLPASVVDYLNSGLISINDKLEPVAGLAEKWEILDDNTTYVFYLKSNLQWSDGSAVKASDIRFSIPNITVETQDPNVIKFHIPTKYAPFLSLLNIPLLNQNGDIVGDYDIRLKQKSSGLITQIILESSTKKIIFNVYSTAKQAITAFKLGQLDTVLELPSDYETELASYAKTKKYTDNNRVVLLTFNQTDPNLKEKSVRQGIAYALKDDSFGYTEALTTINPNSWAYSPIVKTYAYNIERTKELITSPLTLELATTPELLPIAEKIKTDLDSDILKINTKVVTSTPDQFQLFLTTYSISSDPDQYRDWHSTQATNIGRGADEKIDKLLEDGRTTVDNKERKRIYIDFQKTFSEELPALVLYYPTVMDIGRSQSDLDSLGR
ncbi:MAG TPA: ABC transporter substrate-binding protein [Candidatus Woesebacteria bacterium]|mgnify:CR=1 FL=1|nr:ABC transporter substrate-binding protein [Candidatus Woesebacteria bacterium]